MISKTTSSSLPLVAEPPTANWLNPPAAESMVHLKIDWSRKATSPQTPSEVPPGAAVGATIPAASTWTFPSVTLPAPLRISPACTMKLPLHGMPAATSSEPPVAIEVVSQAHWWMVPPPFWLRVTCIQPG
jgi:hypothetical protein